MDTLAANWKLYAIAVGAAAAFSSLLTPLVRAAALRFGWMDAPSSAVKTHKVSTPSLGGIAIAIGAATGTASGSTGSGGAPPARPR